LESYADSSFARFWYPSRRWSFEYPEFGAEFAGGLADTRAGRRNYRDYLAWLSETEVEAKRLGFETMSRGWMKGTKDFKKAVLKDLRDEQIRGVVEAEASEMREPRWERALAKGLAALGRQSKDLADCRKGEGWTDLCYARTPAMPGSLLCPL